jgi:hypothetical protein
MLTRTRQVELGGLYRKTGARQAVWRVAGHVRHAALPHVKLTQLDSPSTQMTISVATLTDTRFFLPAEAE